jgi:hypothetical protein
MSCTIFRAALLGAAGTLTIAASSAAAHGFAGARFFPATLATDDPFVADELSLPTFSTIRSPGGGGPDVQDSELSIDIAKRLTRDFGIELGETYVHLKPVGGTAQSGFANLALGGKYQLGIDAASETIWAIGVDADIGGTGAKRIGAEDFSTITPAFFFGKGFVDLPDDISLLRPLALTGSIGVSIPTRAHSTDDSGGIVANSDTLKLGFALEYSFIYLQSQVRNVGLGTPFDRLIPLIEVALEKPIDRGGGEMTGTINPGVLWAGQYLQLGVEAVIPINHTTGDHVGFIAQLHFFVDDLFPASIGRPIFGG